MSTGEAVYTFAKSRNKDFPRQWLVTDFTVDQIERRVDSTDAALKRIAKKNAELEAEIAKLRAKFDDRIPVCRFCATSHDPGTDCPTHEVMAMVYATMQDENKTLRKNRDRLKEAEKLLSDILGDARQKHAQGCFPTFNHQEEVIKFLGEPQAAIDAAMKESK